MRPSLIIYFTLVCLVFQACETEYSAETYLRSGNSCEERKLQDSAVYWYSRGIDENPDNAALLFARGRILWGINDSSAERDLQAASEKAANNCSLLAKINSHLGWMHVNKSEYAEALPYLNKAYNSYKECGDLLDQLTIQNEIGSCYSQAGDYDKALDLYTEVLSHPKLKTTGLTNRARVYAIKGEFQKAIHDLDLIVESEPENLHSRYMRGNNFLSLGRFQQACADFMLIKEQITNAKRGEMQLTEQEHLGLDSLIEAHCNAAK